MLEGKTLAIKVTPGCVLPGTELCLWELKYFGLQLIYLFQKEIFCSF